jgi:hypothetical protein
MRWEEELEFLKSELLHDINYASGLDKAYLIASDMIRVLTEIQNAIRQAQRNLESIKEVD